jgi:hypothetical protein
LNATGGIDKGLNKEYMEGKLEGWAIRVINICSRLHNAQELTHNLHPIMGFIFNLQIEKKKIN